MRQQLQVSFVNMYLSIVCFWQKFNTEVAILCMQV